MRSQVHVRPIQGVLCFNRRPPEAHLPQHFGKPGEVFEKGRNLSLGDYGYLCRGLHIGCLVKPILPCLLLKERDIRQLKEKLAGGERVRECFSADSYWGHGINQSVPAPVDGILTTFLDPVGDAGIAFDAPLPGLVVDAMKMSTYVLPSGPRKIQPSRSMIEAGIPVAWSKGP